MKCQHAHGQCKNMAVAEDAWERRIGILVIPSSLPVLWEGDRQNAGQGYGHAVFQDNVLLVVGPYRGFHGLAPLIVLEHDAAFAVLTIAKPRGLVQHGAQLLPVTIAHGERLTREPEQCNAFLGDDRDVRSHGGSGSLRP